MNELPIEYDPITQTVTETFEMIMRHDHGAACLWHTMISMPEIWHYRIPDLAKRINVCETTCKKKMNILIRLGVVYRYRNPDNTTEYEVFQTPQYKIKEQV